MRALSLSLLLLSFTVGGQTLVPTLLTPLNTALNETSGILVIDGHVWTELDSGNPNELYELDPGTGEILRTVTISNAGNIDWEAITKDDDHVYVGDLGNNSGSRTDLRIYRFPLSELMDPDVTSVVVDTIAFSYADQVDFTPANNANNWDCEAMIALDDSLFLFTKNWQNGQCYSYSLSAEPGVHSAQRRDTLDTQGMVTGASYDQEAGGLVLCGYSSVLAPFVWQLWGFPDHHFFNGTAVRHPVQLPFGQIEAIAWSSLGTAYMTNEQNPLSTARLWQLVLDVITDVGPQLADGGMSVVTDPSLDRIIITTPDQANARIIDIRGTIVLQQLLDAGENVLSTARLSDGVYVVNTGSGVAPVRFVVVR